MWFLFALVGLVSLEILYRTMSSQPIRLLMRAHWCEPKHCIGGLSVITRKYFEQWHLTLLIESKWNDSCNLTPVF